MGADPYWYYVPYQEDKNRALQKLRQREFEAGRYRPVMYTGSLDFPLDPLQAPAPGKAHATMEAALEEALASGDGTGSVLDLQGVSGEDYFGVAHLVEPDLLMRHFQTEKPTRELIDKHIWALWDELAHTMGLRGAGICITVYQEDLPTELLFMGHSWD